MFGDILFAIVGSVFESAWSSSSSHSSSDNGRWNRKVDITYYMPVTKEEIANGCNRWIQVGRRMRDGTTRAEMFQVTHPPNIIHGQATTFAQCGHEGGIGEQNGDLYVIVTTHLA